MSKITVALEDAVSRVIANTAPEGTKASARQRAAADRAFADILKLIAPRIRHFIRQYGLAAHWDDAEQCCAIGVHRAIQAYDPSRAQFTTFVNWQLRGELQDLRFRLMTDQRPSARKVSATTVSLHSAPVGSEGEEGSLEGMIVDQDALERTEAGASAHLAERTRRALIDQYVDHLRTVGMEQLRRRARGRGARPAEAGAPRLRSALYPVDAAEIAQLEEKIALHRDAIERRLSEDPVIDVDLGDEAARERTRQIAKRASAAIAEMAGASTRFDAPLAPTPRWRRKPPAPVSAPQGISLV